MGVELSGGVAGFVAGLGDGNQIVTQDFTESGNGKVLGTLTAEGVVHGCAFASDGRRIVAGDASGRVHILRLVLPEDAVE